MPAGAFKALMVVLFLGFGGAGCTDLAMQNYDRAFKNRQITPTEYRRAQEDLDRRVQEYNNSPEARKS